MTDRTSLFARKLRDWRTRHGTHGRMTQETLAETLGVSVDAIGKYERSVSFIRGDLEHRLAEKLSWDRGEIQACREDWEARQTRPRQSAYSLLDDAVVDQMYGGSWNSAISAAIKMVDKEFGELPAEFAVDEAVFLPIYDAYRGHWAAVMHNGEFVAKWGMVFLLPNDEARFKAGTFTETELTLEGTHRPILPGTYYGYCTAVVIKSGHEAAGVLLLSSFIHFLEDLAARDILFHGIGSIACSMGGTQICRDLGMAHLGNHSECPEYGIWNLSGAAMAKSLFVRRNPSLQLQYADAFHTQTNQQLRTL